MGYRLLFNSFPNCFMIVDFLAETYYFSYLRQERKLTNLFGLFISTESLHICIAEIARDFLISINTLEALRTRFALFYFLASKPSALP